MPPSRRPATDVVPSRQSQRVKKPPSLPGEPDPAPKQRRTKEEIQRDREEKEAKKAEKTRKDQEKLQGIADLEDRMAAVDAKTNQANRPKPRPIRRTYSVRDLMSPLNEEDLYVPSEEAPSVREDNESNATDIDIDAPQKTRKTKASVRTSIQAIRKAHTNSVARTDGEKMTVNDEVQTGQTRGSTT